MNRPHEPAERHARHDELHALERLAGARPVVHEQQRARDDLDDEEEQGGAARVVEDRVAVLRHAFVPQELDDFADGRTLREPRAQRGHHPLRVSTI